MDRPTSSCPFAVNNSHFTVANPVILLLYLATFEMKAICISQNQNLQIKLFYNRKSAKKL